MSALTEKIAAEHEPQLIEGSWSDYYDCTCGAWSSLDTSDEHSNSLSAHVAEVTEAALRAQIASEIEAQETWLRGCIDFTANERQVGLINGYRTSARIARKDAS